MFKEIWKDQSLIGHLFPFKRGFAFFGTVHFQKNNFKEYFPDFDFRILKQIHSARVIKTQKEPIEADGHWTQEKNVALLIQTADCVPLMIETSKRVIALHAGWRGVEQDILTEALNSLDADELKQLTLAAGPHISTRSFEVGQDVAERLLRADPIKDLSVILPHSKPHKRYVDLQKILLHQARACSPSAQISFLGIDTVSSEQHHSFRRNGPRAGRLYSFIVSTD